MNFFLTLFLLNLFFYTTAQESYNRTWATYFGGSDFDISDAVTDRFGNLVIAATVSTSVTSTISNDVDYYNQFKTDTGLPFQANMAGGFQSFVAKFSPDGDLLFATFLPYEITKIEQNKQNKWLISGFTNKTNLGTVGAWLQYPLAISTGASYPIITQLQEDFTIDWLTYQPKNGSMNSFDDFYIDDYHNIYFHTIITDASFPNLTTPNTFQPIFILQYDSNNEIIPNGYLCKLNNLGQRQWSTFVGMMDVEGVNKINEELLIYGRRLEDISAFDTYYCTEANCIETNFIVAKFDLNNGQRISGKYIPSTIFVGGKMVTDGSNFYFINCIPGNDTPTLNAYQPANGGEGYDLYLTKYNSNLQLQWATYIGGSGIEYLSDFTNWLEYKNDFLYFRGYTDSPNNFIFSPNPYSATKQGSDDNFMMKFNTNGELVWGSYYGGTGQEGINGKMVSTSNDAFYICGNTTSTNSMTTSGCHQETMNIHPLLNMPFLDKWNCYIAKFSPEVLNSNSFSENAIQIYPNPSNEILSIIGTNLSKEKHQLNIFNELGQQVYTKKMAFFNEYTINLNHLSKGVYFITLQSEETNFKQTEKLIIK